jgi:hypothetical protein
MIVGRLGWIALWVATPLMLVGLVRVALAVGGAIDVDWAEAGPPEFIWGFVLLSLGLQAIHVRLIKLLADHIRAGKYDTEPGTKPPQL